MIHQKFRKVMNLHGQEYVLFYLNPNLLKPQDIKTYPVPEDEKEQMKMKRFKADPNFAINLPSLAPALL